MFCPLQLEAKRPLSFSPKMTRPLAKAGRHLRCHPTDKTMLSRDRRGLSEAISACGKSQPSSTAVQASGIDKSRGNEDVDRSPGDNHPWFDQLCDDLNSMADIEDMADIMEDAGGLPQQIIKDRELAERFLMVDPSQLRRQY